MLYLGFIEIDKIMMKLHTSLALIFSSPRWNRSRNSIHSSLRRPILYRLFLNILVNDLV